MRYGSVCSGIEAATQAWHPLGWRPAFFSEIEKFPSAVLAHHYGSNMPDETYSQYGVPNYGDLNNFKEWPDHGQISNQPIDLLVGGTPCQSFSIAGLRKGLADPRGNLSLTYLALLERYRPRWCVWENVPGVLSSNEGRDFSAFLGGLAELGYGWSYRVLDAQYVRTRLFPWAVPQRRRRVFVVGYLGDWRRAAAVLFDRESLSRNPPPRRQAGQGVAADVAQCLVSSGRGVERTGDTRGQDNVVASLVAADQTAIGEYGDGSTASTVMARDFKSATDLVAHALRGEGFDDSEDGTGRGTPLVPVAYRTTGNDGAYQTGDVVGALTTATDPAAQIVAFAENSRAEVRLCGGDGQVSSQLTTGGGKPGQGSPAIAIQERAVSENPNAGPDGAGVRDDGASYTLEARQTVQAVAYDMRGREGGAQFEGPHDTANLRAASGGSSRSYVGLQWAVRRLTPTECERLQGFPDGYTQIPWRGKPAEKCPDGPRYKGLGNSMPVNVMGWIGERIQMVEDMQ